MKKVYACLVGNWVCLNDDDNCKIGNNLSSPSDWLREDPEIWSPIHKDKPHTYNQLDYVELNYEGKDYRINPIFIQIVTE